MSLHLETLLQKYAANRDPQDAVNYVEALLHNTEIPKPLQKPLNIKQIRKLYREAKEKDEEQISGYVTYGLTESLDQRLYEDFLDNVSRKFVDSDLLQNIDFDVVGLTADGECILKVTGDPSAILDAEND